MNSDDGIEYLESNLRYFLNSYKEKFLSGEIKKIDDNFIKSIKKDVDKEIIESFNIDTFFRGIKNILSENNIIKRKNILVVKKN